MRFDPSLLPRRANFVPLTPVDFLRRSVEVHPDKIAVVFGKERLSYRDLGKLTGSIAAALRLKGVGAGDVVSVLAANRPEMLAMHFAVPMVGAVLNAINTRLDVDTVAYILDHSGSVLLFNDVALLPLAAGAVQATGSSIQLVSFGAPSGGVPTLGELLAGVDPDPITLDAITDEWQPITLNYTSGTTGRPKGVVCHHRGAYLNSLGNVLALGFDVSTVYLWTLPMFHCNGWQHPWAITAAGGTHLCMERVDPAEILRQLDEGGVTHFACAPVVLYMLLSEADRTRASGRRVRVATGGAAPTSALLEGLDALGIDIVHLYGLTESYGPATLCVLPDGSSKRPASEKAQLLARQGVRHPLVASVRVVDDRGADVPKDARTVGEIVIRSNTLMAGYYQDPTATADAFSGDVFHTGDLAVRHADGQLEIKDRSKDIIISGGENISSLEVESVLHQHPDVLIAAVVAAPDPKWGEVPCACIELKPDAPPPGEAELIDFCRKRIARFKVPRRIVFCDLPKTATGKIQKYALRAMLAGE